LPGVIFEKEPAAADAGSVQLAWQVLMIVLRRTSPVRL
jgi:hypothetical protein